MSRVVPQRLKQFSLSELTLQECDRETDRGSEDAERDRQWWKYTQVLYCTILWYVR